MIRTGDSGAVSSLAGRPSLFAEGVSDKSTVVRSLSALCLTTRFDTYPPLLIKVENAPSSATAPSGDSATT